MTTLFPRTLVPTALSGRHARTPATALEPARPERARVARLDVVQLIPHLAPAERRPCDRELRESSAPERARAARFSR